MLDPDFRPVIQQHRYATAAAMQADGKTVVGGRFDFVNGVARRGLARLNGGGSFDPTFNPPEPEIGPESEAWRVEAIAIQSDQKVLVGGAGFAADEWGHRLFRLNPDVRVH